MAVVVLAAVAAAVAYGVVARPFAGARRGRGTTEAPTTTRSVPRTTVPSTTTTSVPPTTLAPTATTGPGTLPQTDAFPSSSTSQFQAEMAALWQGVVTGHATPAMPAFFPESAYAQLKSLPDPRADWEERLVRDFGLDVSAAHAVLGGAADSAKLVAVDVPSGYGHWVPAGVCSNSIGYYELPNARVVYDLDGSTRSFGIASMISWRGEWYVVHLGAILRSTTGGVVDDPATGPGASAPSSTC